MPIQQPRRHGLIMVDLRSTDAGVLARYMGEYGARAFFAHHAAGTDAAARSARGG